MDFVGLKTALQKAAQAQEEQRQAMKGTVCGSHIVLDKELGDRYEVYVQVSVPVTAKRFEELNEGDELEYDEQAEVWIIAKPAETDAEKIARLEKENEQLRVKASAWDSEWRKSWFN